MSRRSRPSFEVAGLTDRGLVRPENEDALLMRPGAGLFLDADGVSTSCGGGVAALLAVDTVARQFAPLPPPARSLREDVPDATRRLVDAFLRADAVIALEAKRRHCHGDMAAIIVALAVVQDCVIIAHLDTAVRHDKLRFNVSPRSRQVIMVRRADAAVPHADRRRPRATSA